MYVLIFFGGKFTDDIIQEIQDPKGYKRTAARVERYNTVKRQMKG